MADRTQQLASNGLPPGGGGGRSPQPELVDQALLSAIFLSFPAGILVVDRTGTVIAYNRAVAEAFANPTAGQDTCCLLLGCREEGRLGQGGCLTQLALDSDGPLPPIRFNPPASTNGELWITAVTFDESGSRVVFLVRPLPRDRLNGHRPQAALRISLLGPTVADAEGSPIAGDWLHQRPGQLLNYLALRRDRVAHTEQIAEALRPDSGANASNAVRHLIHVLREKLEPERVRAASSFVLQQGRGYRLNPATVRVDVDEFEAHVRVGLLAFAEGNREVAGKRLERALALYRGELLADLPYAEWALLERERLRELAGRSLRALVSLRLDEHDLDAAEACMERLAEMEPFDTEIQRQHITLCMKRGRYSRASRLYALFQRRLLQEFGEAPAFELAEIRRELPGADL
jgi:DNA-binding SARP family transcriptional activator